MYLSWLGRRQKFDPCSGKEVVQQSKLFRFVSLLEVNSHDVTLFWVSLAKYMQTILIILCEIYKMTKTFFKSISCRVYVCFSFFINKLHTFFIISFSDITMKKTKNILQLAVSGESCFSYLKIQREEQLTLKVSD